MQYFSSDDILVKDAYLEFQAALQCRRVSFFKYQWTMQRDASWVFIDYPEDKWIGISPSLAEDMLPSGMRLLRNRFHFDAAVDYLTVTFPHMQEEFLVVELEKVPENLNESRIAS